MPIYSMEIKVLPIREGVKIPTKAHKGDAGWDLYHNPEVDVSIFLHPGETTLIKTGIKVACPDDWYLEVKNRSGVASKKQLIVGAHVIDSSYRGEVFVNLHNIGKSIVEIKPGDKIAQMVSHYIGQNCIQVVTEEEYNKLDSARGEGCLGSSGN